MINERPLLTIRRSVVRPDRHLIERFRGAATVHLADAMDGRGALDYRIKATSQAATFVGSALTCQAGPDDTLAILAALDLAHAGDVIVAATEGFTGSAVVGDLFAAMAVTAGVAAIVTDGLARDSDGIAKTGLPVFAAGISPNSAARSGPGTVGLPIMIGGILIGSGDVIVGDRDGVFVVRRDDINVALKGLEAVRAAEASYSSGSADGVRVPDSVRELLRSERVKYLD